MYTLRIIHDEKGKNGKFSSRRENINLGDNYTVYPRGSDECDKTIKEGNTEWLEKNLISIVESERGDKFLITKKDSKDESDWYYIVTESGKTFERLY